MHASVSWRHWPGRINDRRAVRPLIAALTDQNVDVREQAAEALGDLKDARAVEPLINALMDENSSVPPKAAESLSKIGTPAAELLLAAVNEENLVIAARTYSFLICIGEPGTEQLLIKALDQHGTVRMAEDFLNSGNALLAEAARKWAGRQGQELFADPGKQGSPKWGSR